MKSTHNLTVVAISIVLRNLVFAYVIERLFWEARGMSVADVVFAEYIYVGLILLLEIPAGIVSDRGNRRTVLVAAAVLTALEFVIVALATRFVHFAAAVAVAAVGEVLTSGTWNALIYESLEADGRGDEFTRVLGRLEALDSVSLVAALLAGGWLAELLGQEPLYWIAAGGAGLAAAATLLLRDLRPDRAAGAPAARERAGELARGIRLFMEHGRLVAALAAAIAVGGSITYFDEFLSLHLRDVGFPVWSFGLVVGGAYIARGLGALAGERLESLAERRGFFPFAVVVFLAAQLAFGVAGRWVGLALVALLYLTWGALEVLAASRIHHAAESHFRATAESVASQIEQVAALGFGAVFIVASRHLSIAGAVAATAAAGAACYGAYLAGRGWRRRRRA